MPTFVKCGLECRQTGMVQLAEDARFMLKLRFPARASNQIFLNCVLLIRLQVYRQIDMSKAAAAQNTLNTIAPVQYRT